MHVVVTRAEPDAIKLRGVLESRGHGATVAPMLAVEFLQIEPVELEGVTALIATSRNALRALVGSDTLEIARSLSVFAVGTATAEEARRMSFARVVKGPGTAEALAPLIASLVDPSEEVLMHLAGERLAFDLAGELRQLGINVASRTIYRTRAASALPDGVCDAIAIGDVDAVMLMSPQTATVWARLIAHHGLADKAREIVHLCISDAVADRLSGLCSVPLETAAEPTLEGMLALVDLVAGERDD